MIPKSYAFTPPYTTKRGSKANSEKHPAIILCHQEDFDGENWVVATIHWKKHTSEISEKQNCNDYSQVLGPAIRTLFGWFTDEALKNAQP